MPVNSKLTPAPKSTPLTPAQIRRTRAARWAPKTWRRIQPSVLRPSAAPSLPRTKPSWRPQTTPRLRSFGRDPGRGGRNGHRNTAATGHSLLDETPGS